MSVATQRDAALIAAGIDPANVEYHHEPPLSIRPYDAKTGKWSPDANDPRHIVPMETKAHKQRTPADISRAAKTKRQEKAEAEFRARLLAKATGDDPVRARGRKLQGRPFGKQHRPMNGRNA